jgi:hypothetical protein
MSPLERAIAQRNARLRAWRDFGVPVRGGWRSLTMSARSAGVEFAVECEVCGWREGEFRIVDHGPEWTAVLTEQEQDVLSGAHAGAVHQYPAHCCGHLEPMRGPDPENFAAFVALALLEAP